MMLLRERPAVVTATFAGGTAAVPRASSQQQLMLFVD